MLTLLANNMGYAFCSYFGSSFFVVIAALDHGEVASNSIQRQHADWRIEGSRMPYPLGAMIEEHTDISILQMHRGLIVKDLSQM